MTRRTTIYATLGLAVATLMTGCDGVSTSASSAAPDVAGVIEQDAPNETPAASVPDTDRSTTTRITASESPSTTPQVTAPATQAPAAGVDPAVQVPAAGVSDTAVTSPPPPTSPPSPPLTASAPPDGDAQFECGSSLSGPAALTPVLPEIVAPPGGWDLAASDFSGFDPCEPVSWIALVGATPGASAADSSADSGSDLASDPARQVVLFSYGEPIQTAFGLPTALEPKFQRQGHDGVLLTAFFVEDGQAMTSWGPAARLSFTYDAQRHSFVQEGTFDSDPALADLGVMAFSAAPEPIPALLQAAAGAGGLVPPSSREIDLADPVGAVRVTAGDVTCVLGSAGAGCTTPLREDVALLEEPRATEGAGFVPAWEPMGAEVDAEVALVDGEVRHLGPYVVAGQARGLTVWNARTGHGYVLGESAEQF